MRQARMHAMVVTSLMGLALGLTLLGATAQAKTAVQAETAMQARGAMPTALMGNALVETTARSAIAPAVFSNSDAVSTTARTAVHVQRPVQQSDLATDAPPARLKIRFSDDDSVRVLPNGQLFSLSGHDVSSMQSVLDTHDVSAVSAVAMPESQVASIRASFEQRTGRPMEDIGGSMWLDGAPDAVDRALVALHDTGRLRAASFTSSTVARSADKGRTPPMAHAKQGRGLPGVVLNIHDVGLDFPDIPAPQQPPHVWEKPVFNVASALKAHDGIVRHRVREAQQYAQDRNKEHMPPTRGVAVYCCVFTLTGLPGEEFWEKRCEGSLGDMTADACDDLNIDGLSVAFVRAEWTGPGDPNNDCFTNCLNNILPANNFGACCILPGTRAGEDMLQPDCADAGGDFQGSTVDPSSYLAYANCDACAQVWGNCCFENVDGTFFAFIWDNTNPIWDKTLCNGAFPETQINEPTVSDIQMRSLDASFYTGWSLTFDQLSAPAGWTWQDPDGPPSQMMNPSFIVNSRLMSNSEDETACERCTALGGRYAFDGTQPQTPVWDGLGGAVAICGQGIGIIDCATGETGPTNVLGPCCVGDGSPLSIGVPTITTFENCRDAATAVNQNPFACWQMNMLLPANSLTPQPEGTDIHEGFWRPWWIMHFTPPSAGTYAVPDIYEWLVPFWEYVGGYTPWTGWDPGRWWDEGFQPNYSPPGFPATTRDQFTQNIFPEFSIASGIMPCFPLNGVEVDGTFINFYRPADYGPTIKFGLPPTCWELIPDYGLPQQPGDWFPWTDPETGAVWPVVPIVNPYVFEMQAIGVQGGDDFPNFFPWEYGRNRWTADWKFFDIMRNAAQNNQLGFSPSWDFSGGTRYLSQRDSGLSNWMYLGDSNRPNPNPDMPPHDDEYGWPYIPDGENPGPGESGEPLRGSCYYQHSDFFPTIPGTEDKTNFPGNQSCYTGSFCDEAACCDSVALFMPQCCTGGELSEWNSLCVQIALDIVLADKMLGADFANWTCTGIHPFAVPQYPGTLPGSGMSGTGQYDPDARNYRLNAYFQSTLPSDLQPSAAVPPMLPDGTANPDWPAYRRQVTMAARIAMFAPRCQGIYSSKGQCNVASTMSGVGSWAVAMDNDDLILGCQDYECCLRVIANMLTEKDTVGSSENDLDWIPRKWTQNMADRATGYVDDTGTIQPPLCYSTTGGTWNLTADPTPDFFPLQLHMGAKALVETLALTATAPKGSRGDVVRQIFGPDGARIPASLVELIPAPFGSPLRESILQPLPNQNIYDVLPGPYYGGDGMAIYPGQIVSAFDGDFESLLKISQNYQSLSGSPVGGLGRSIQIGVLTESAFLQADPVWGLGAVHEDLGNIQPDPFYDWSERDSATGVYANKLAFDDITQTARGTAVLGVLGATSPSANWTEVTVSATGACVLPYFDPAGGCSDGIAQNDCHTLGGTWYTGITCASINDGADRAPVPGTNTFGVQAMAPDARTWFFPTRTESGSRFEDAFLSAITVLQPGDVLMLAMNPDNYADPSGCLLLDPQVQEWVAIAQAFDILVVIPAGDRQVALDFADVEEVLDLNAILVVGGAVPAADGNYLRWWSSNYSAENTVAGRLATSVSMCAWGGLVTTTGGNMNITSTLEQVFVTPPADLTAQRGYTNDFGAQLDGSVAAAAQTAAATACVQGLTRQVYEDVFAPDALVNRLYDTAVTAGTNVGVGYNGAAGTTAGQYSWDLNELADAPNYVGRFPQLASLGIDIALLDPPDNDEIANFPPAFPVEFDVLVGTFVSGNVFYLRMPDDDLGIKVDSVPYPEGPINTTIWLPGGASHLGFGNAIEVMATFKTSGVFNYADIFGVIGQRLGPNRYGMEVPYMFNFTANQWQQLNVSTATLPADASPFPFNYTVFPGIDWRDYLNPDTGDRHNEVYVRLGYSCALSPYRVEFDFMALEAFDLLDDGGGTGP